MKQKAVLHNRFDFEILDIETGKTEYAQAENIVLNNMWTRICGGSSYFGYIGVGTGTGTLSPTRTTLFSHLLHKTAVAVETVYDTDATAHVTKKVTFSETEAIGTWTEVGILYGTSTGSNYVTHALITDSEGNPITIPKTNTKIITIYATVFVEILNTESVGLPKYNLLNTLLDNAPTSKALIVSALKPVSGNLSRLGAVAYKATTLSADVSNKRMTTPVIRFAVGEANADIRSCGLGFIDEISNTMMRLSLYGGVNIPNDIFQKYDYSGVAIGTGDGVTKEFDFPKSFIKPGSESMYIGGSLKTRGTDYTVRYGMRTSDTLLLDINNNNTPAGDFEEIIELQNGTELATITSIVFRNGSKNNGAYNFTNYDIKLSTDMVNWVDAGSGTLTYNQEKTLNSFAAAEYKYLKAKFDRSSAVSKYAPASGQYAGALSYFKVYATPPATKMIKFTVPPATGAAVTSDFSVEYIPKSSNFVLDLQAEILLGEKV